LLRLNHLAQTATHERMIVRDNDTKFILPGHAFSPTVAEFSSVAIIEASLLPTKAFYLRFS